MVSFRFNNNHLEYHIVDLFLRGNMARVPIWSEECYTFICYSHYYRHGINNEDVAVYHVTLGKCINVFVGYIHTNGKKVDNNSNFIDTHFIHTKF